MKKKNDLLSKLAIATTLIGLGSYIYKKVKKCSCFYNNENSESYDDDSSFEIILDDNLENDTELKKEVTTDEYTIENKDA